jgi:dynein heavy chain, axonemal
MMDLNFLDRLKGYDRNNISDNILYKLRKYTTRPDFDPTLVGQKNLASKSLCMWCKAIDNYAKVAKEVEPKKKKLATLEKEFDDKNKILFMKQKDLDKVKEKVAALQKECEETLEFQNKLQSDLDLTGKRLERAEKLTSLLKDEGLRWSTLIEGFKTLIVETPGEAFLASIYLSYLAPYTGEYRQEILTSITDEMKQRSIYYPSSFSLTNTLFDQVTVRDWIL